MSSTSWKGVPRRLFDGRVAEDGGDSHDFEVGGAQCKQDGHRAIDTRIGIDEDLGRFSLGLEESRAGSRAAARKQERFETATNLLELRGSSFGSYAHPGGRLEPTRYRPPIGRGRAPGSGASGSSSRRSLGLSRCGRCAPRRATELAYSERAGISFNCEVIENELDELALGKKGYDPLFAAELTNHGIGLVMRGVITNLAVSSFLRRLQPGSVDGDSIPLYSAGKGSYTTPLFRAARSEQPDQVSMLDVSATCPGAQSSFKNHEHTCFSRHVPGEEG